MTSDDIAPQSIEVNKAPKHMERPIEVAVIAHLNEAHDSVTKVFLTPEGAADLASALIDYLDKEVHRDH